MYLSIMCYMMLLLCIFLNNVFLLLQRQKYRWKYKSQEFVRILHFFLLAELWVMSATSLQADCHGLECILE